MQPNLKLLEAEFLKSDSYNILNKGQREFFTHFFNGENILLTGAAGTGKSLCLTTLFQFMQSKHVFVGKTALTGVAALNIGGSTIHSFAGLGLCDEDTDSIVQNAFNNKRARQRVQNTHVLIVDEVSMASADLINKLDAVMKNLRGDTGPFGSCGIIFSADFLQLPPVFRGQGDQLRFSFESQAWEDANFHVVNLTKLVRQDENTPFAKLLQKIRFGKASAKDLVLLHSRVNVKLNAPLEPIRIFCKNIDVDSFNTMRYNEIKAQEQVFYCRDIGGENYIRHFNKNCQAPPILRLKIGAQVMLLVNQDLEAGLVNGSMGIVDSFSTLGPIVKFANGEKTIIDIHKWEIKEQALDANQKMKYKVVASRSQIPLKLAYCATSHKTQGQTLDYAHVDLSGAFCEGQCYTALSRVRNLESLSLEAFSSSKIKAHPACLEFYRKLKKKGK